MEEPHGGREELLTEVRELRGQLDRFKETEQALAHSERKFRDLAEKSVAGIYILQDGLFKYVNQRFAEIHGYAVDELLQKGAREITYPEDAPIVLENLRKREKGEIESMHYDFRIVTKSGEVRNVEVFGSVTLYEGRPAVIGTVIDITDRKHAEEQIRNLNLELRSRVAELAGANEELRALTYSMSHDLKTPLISIEGFSKRMLDKCSPGLSEKCRGYLEIINGSSSRMIRLIADLLGFFGSGQRDLEPSSVDMSKLVQEVLGELEPLYHSREVHITTDSFPSIPGDRAMIKQVWINLLGNALKFTGTQEKATIKVGYSAEPERHVFYVRDNGVGFPMDKADRLFQTFSRLHETSEFEGTGLGLAIVKRIIERHGGEVWAESSPGSGATFYFSLPKAPHLS